MAIPERLSSRHDRDDRGNTLIIAMAVLMIMGILAAAVWAKTLSGLNRSGYDKTHLSVIAVANSGLDEAMFRLEQLNPDDFNITDTLTGSGEMSGGSFTYTAIRKDDLTWEILSVAEIGDAGSPYTIRRAIRADARTTSRFDVAVGGKSSVSFSGNPFDTSNACTYDSRDFSNYPIYCADGSHDGDLTSALIGTSGTLACTGSNDWDEFPVVLWPPQSSTANNNNCNNLVPPPPAPYPWEPVVAPQPGGSNALMDNGAGDCNLTGADVASVLPGVYNCTNLVLGAGGNQAMCTNNAVDMWNPVEIYVSGDLDFASGAYLNVGPQGAGGCAGSATGPTIDGVYPTAMAGSFRVFKASSTEIGVPGGANKPVMSMVLYAPDSSFTLNGGPQVYIFGSVMVDQFDTNGAVNVLAYDRSLSLLTTKKYYVQNWTEVRAPA